MANVLSTPKRIAIVSALTEGCSIRSTARMVGVSKDTVMKLWREIGEACIAYQDANLRGLTCERLQVDEIWSFVYAKAKNVPQAREGEFGVGDVWTFTAIDAETKLMPLFMVGSRDAGTATEFMQDLAGRLVNRPQITTDGHGMYPGAVEDAFGGAVDFAQLVKSYANAPTGPETRYSPAVCTGADKRPVIGTPDPRHISTSYVERSNLTIRMSVRRWTRLTNAFSKKLENHVAAFGLFSMHYNFCRIHKTLRVTPAMAAGVSATVWTIADLVALLPTAATGPRGPYRKAVEQ